MTTRSTTANRSITASWADTHILNINRYQLLLGLEGTLCFSGVFIPNLYKPATNKFSAINPGAYTLFNWSANFIKL